MNEIIEHVGDDEIIEHVGDAIYHIKLANGKYVAWLKTVNWLPVIRDQTDEINSAMRISDKESADELIGYFRKYGIKCHLVKMQTVVLESEEK